MASPREIVHPFSGGPLRADPAIASPRPVPHRYIQPGASPGSSRTGGNMLGSIRVTLAALVLGACASGGSGGPGAAAPRHNPDVITSEEMAEAHVLSAYDAVAQLRPSFLISQGGTTRSHPIQVIVDDVPRGGVSVLRGIQATEILEIRRISASEATQQWGTGYTGGALVVRTVAKGPRG